MPTILRTGPYRIYFYSHEPNEPPHVHVDREAMTMKAWLRPVRVAANHGFARQELNQILRLLADHQTTLWDAWHEFHGN